MDPDKEIRADAKLKNLVERDPQAAEDLWRFRYPEEGGSKITFDEILVEIPLRYGFTVALSTLSEFYSWFKRRRRIEAARATADQGKRDMAMLRPEASLQEVEAYGQWLFTNECIDAEDREGFAKMKVISQNDERLAQNRQALEFQRMRIELLQKQREDALEAKAKLTAVAAKAKTAGGLTMETLREIEEAARLL